MGSSPRVRCGKVELRLLTPRRSNELFTLARDPAVSRLLQWPAHRTVDDSLEYIRDAWRLWEEGRAWLPGIFDHASDELVGCIGLSGIDRMNRRAEVGTWIGLPFQGRGYNLPAKGAVAAFAFDVLELARLEFLTRVDNPRSVGAMRHVPAVREEGVLAQRVWRDDVGYDAHLFSMLAEDFARSAWPPIELRAGGPPPP